MRALRRNQTGLFYALYESETDTVNADGKKTGGKTKVYSTPVFLRANISPATGRAMAEAFGKDLNYSHILYVSGRNCPITEESILWIYDGLTEDSDLSGLVCNYAVVGIAKSLNETLYAIRQKGVDRRGATA